MEYCVARKLKFVIHEECFWCVVNTVNGMKIVERKLVRCHDGKCVYRILCPNQRSSPEALSAFFRFLHVCACVCGNDGGFS